MKSNTKYNKRSHLSWSSYKLTIRSLIICTLILASSVIGLHAQDAKYTRPSVWIGAAGAANLNYYRGSTQELNSTFTAPAAFHNGFAIGLYAAPLVEFHRPETNWGVMLQAGYDNRSGAYDQIKTPCNCPADLSNSLSYITMEPSLRFAPFKSDFYLYAGPRMAFNIDKQFTYKQGINPAYPDQVANPDVSGDFNSMKKFLVSAQIGAGYDIQLSSQNKHTQTVLSPFVSFQPYFGQDPRTIESWNITTVRVGAALKFGRGHKNQEPVEAIAPIPVKEIVEPEVTFTANAPKNIPVERRVRETFPVRNYVFFNLGSTEIPDRYVLLRKSQVKEFKEDQLEVFTPKELTGRSKRQMTVYYNVLNILGDRMQKNPTATVMLSGASMKGTKDAREMAESVKNYLVDIFGIEASRITIEGRIKPRIPSEKEGGKLELDLLREGDHRVSIWSTSPAIMMEFQSGPAAPLKPIEIIDVQAAPVDSYVSFDVQGAEDAFSSWSLEITDEQGNVKNFGPYTQEAESIPGKSILGLRPAGDYKITMIGQYKSGKIVRKETTAHLVLWTPPVAEEMMRFSILYEFNNSKAITIYEKYLTDIVIPKIPKGGTVIIHGHTDIIGGEANNLTLSLARANDVKTILENGMIKAGRNDITFEVYGFGEDQDLAPFNNKYPEERFYNRTVILDIIPPK